MAWLQYTAEKTTRESGIGRYLASFGFLVLFAAVVEFFFGWGALLEPWSDLDVATVGGIIVLLFATYVARALRLYRYFGRPLDFPTAFKLLLQHNLWIVLLPARTGELAFPVLMQRYFGIAPGQSIPVLLWFRVLDLHSLVLVVACAWLWTVSPAAATLFASGWTGSLAIVLAARPAIVRFLAARPGKLASWSHRFLATTPVTVAKLVESWAWTIVCWTTKLLLFAWIISAFTSLRFLPSLAGAVGGEVSSTLPIHGIGGFGTYHAGVASALLPFGVSVENAVQGGINLHLVVLGGAVASGLLAHAVPRGLLRRGGLA